MFWYIVRAQRERESEETILRGKRAIYQFWTILLCPHNCHVFFLEVWIVAIIGYIVQDLHYEVSLSVYAMRILSLSWKAESPAG